MKNALKMRF